MRALVGLAVAALLVTSGCRSDGGVTAIGDPVASAPPPGPTPGPVIAAEAAGMGTVVTCGPPGETFPAAILPHGVQGVLSRREAKNIFALLLEDQRWDDILRLSFLTAGTRTRWRVLRHEPGGVYVFGLGRWTASGPGAGATVLRVDRVEGRWVMGPSGECRLTPPLGPRQTWLQLTEPGSGLDRSSRTPVIGVTEQSCTGGRDPRPFLREPRVVETTETVTVYWTTTRQQGGGFCIGPPPTEVDLPLASPIGSRQLLDGSSYPPRVVGPSSLGSMGS